MIAFEQPVMTEIVEQLHDKEEKELTETDLKIREVRAAYEDFRSEVIDNSAPIKNDFLINRKKEQIECG